MSVHPGAGRNGQPALRVESVHGTATVYLQGAHVTSWIPAGRPDALFVSAAARFAPGEPIRGGVPICFPQFAELGPLPMHGFARVVPWEWSERADGGVTMTLRDTEATRALWPHRFTAAYDVALGPSTLSLTFRVRNEDRAPWRWSGTLHTFVALDARAVRIAGLGPAWFVDRGNGSRPTEDRDSLLRIRGHTDRAYLDAGPAVRADDGMRRVEVAKDGFRDTVVWNPGPETSARFPDLARDDHARFVCIEAAEVRAVDMAPGAAWQGSQILRVDGV